MSKKRNASEQVAFRIEPELAKLWSDFISESLITNKAHLVSAMLMYLSATPSQRELIHRYYARFQASGVLEEISTVGADSVPENLSSDEFALLTAFRAADQDARDEAIVNLQERSSESDARNAGIA